MNQADDRYQNLAGGQLVPAVRIDKPWGHETIFALVDGLYCGKVLHINAGESLSLQYHEAKDETIHALDGVVVIHVGPDENSLVESVLEPGMSLRIRPGVVHRIGSPVGSVGGRVLEASTTQLDDVVRLKDRYGR